MSLASLEANPFFKPLIEKIEAKSNVAKGTPPSEGINPQPVARPRPVREPMEMNIVRPTPNFGSTRRGVALDSFKDGTPYVPETGLYQLHEGEAVVPKEKNLMNAADAMAGITGKSKPPKKIKTITHHKTDDGKTIHTHRHHFPEHHPDTTHVSNDDKEMTAHLAEHMPNMSAQPPEMPAPGADAGAAGGAGASPAAAPAM